MPPPRRDLRRCHTRRRRQGERRARELIAGNNRIALVGGTGIGAVGVAAGEQTVEPLASTGERAPLLRLKAVDAPGEAPGLLGVAVDDRQPALSGVLQTRADVGHAARDVASLGEGVLESDEDLEQLGSVAGAS